MSRKMITVIAVLGVIALATGGALALANDTATPGPSLIGSASATPTPEPAETSIVSASPTPGASGGLASKSGSASPSVHDAGDNSGPGGDDDDGQTFDDPADDGTDDNDDSGQSGDDPGSDDD